MANRKKRTPWQVPAGTPLTDFDKRMMALYDAGEIIPTRAMIKSPEDIAGIRAVAVVNTGLLDMLAQEIHAGMTTADIDRLVYDYTTAHGAEPADLGYEGYPKSCCTSLNEVVCHGIPSEEEELWEGDILNVDVTTRLDGYYADASRMYLIGRVDKRVERLVSVCKECLDLGAAAAQPWQPVSNIGKAIERHATKHGYSVVHEFAGHGVGFALHEEPYVNHYNTRRREMLLVPGMVFTIEPMINMGGREVFIDEDDGWTVVTEDELPSAQWEHTYLMTEHGVEIISQ